MLKRYNPSTITAPFSGYSHGVEGPGSARWLHISGQVGVAANGQLAQGAEAQMEQAWRNIFAILESAGLTRQDLVKVTVYLTRTEDIGRYREMRDRMLEGAEPASTLLIVAGLASPDWLVEIEAVAATD